VLALGIQIGSPFLSCQELLLVGGKAVRINCKYNPLPLLKKNVGNREEQQTCHLMSTLIVSLYSQILQTLIYTCEKETETLKKNISNHDTLSVNR
jgi:hypothetical protein